MNTIYLVNPEKCFFCLKSADTTEFRDASGIFGTVGLCQACHDYFSTKQKAHDEARAKRISEEPAKTAMRQVWMERWKKDQCPYCGVDRHTGTSSGGLLGDFHIDLNAEPSPTILCARCRRKIDMEDLERRLRRRFEVIIRPHFVKQTDFWVCNDTDAKYYSLWHAFEQSVSLRNILRNKGYTKSGDTARVCLAVAYDGATSHESAEKLCQAWREKGFPAMWGSIMPGNIWPNNFHPATWFEEFIEHP